MSQTRFWQSHWFLGLLITLFFIFTSNSRITSELEWLAYNMGAAFASAPEPDEKIIVVAIDDKSLETLGEWPWTRDKLATVVNQLTNAGARVVGITLPLHLAESAQSTQVLDEKIKALDEEKNKKKIKANKPIKRTLRQVRDELDNDQQLANSLIKTRGLLPITDGGNHQLLSLSPSDAIQRLDQHALKNIDLSDTSWQRFIPTVFKSHIPEFSQPLPPLDIFSEHVPAGHLTLQGMSADSSKAIPLLLKQGENYYPSFSLLFAARSLGIRVDSISASGKQGIKLQGETLNSDNAFFVYPRAYEKPADGQAFKHYSFADVYEQKINRRLLRNRYVLIGVTSEKIVAPVYSPSGEHVAPVTALAHISSNLINNHLYAIPSWTLHAQLLAFTIVAIYLMFVLPRLHFWTGLVSSLMLFLGLINTQLLVLMGVKLAWVPLVSPTLALLIGSLLIALKRITDERHEIVAADLNESNKILGQNLQSQGQLDQAFEKYRKCRINEELLQHLYNLGLDYERKRQFSKAEMVYSHILSQRKNYRDVKERADKNKKMHGMVALPTGGGNLDATLVLTDQGIEKPVLGRYEVEKEIGRGAMGIVYQGIDPKIGRKVAIKTVALSQEFDQHALDEVKSNFFREAEAAGRLNHPNIVTIYDVGEEHELAYIAMDFLSGQDLSHHCSEGKSLDLKTVLKIGEAVANALDYAHRNNVVHRDIKPANIVYNPDNGETKVTDFGVARLVDSSKTKTGTLLGSPSYMSPEQINGERLDGRSDLFSLGVTLFRLATGKLPFESDSIAALSNKITNAKHPDTKKLLPDAPQCFHTLINKALNKSKDKRYQDGAQMAKSIRQCLKNC